MDEFFRFVSPNTPHAPKRPNRMNYRPGINNIWMNNMFTGLDINI